MQVRDLMTPNPVFIGPGTPVAALVDLRRCLRGDPDGGYPFKRQD